jgi:hypothetical protein
VGAAGIDSSDGHTAPCKLSRQPNGWYPAFVQDARCVCGFLCKISRYDIRFRRQRGTLHNCAVTNDNAKRRFFQ